MTTVYVILAVVGCFAFLIWMLVGKTEDNAEHEQLLKTMEAEIELRKKMAEADASVDVDNPLDGL